MAKKIAIPQKVHFNALSSQIDQLFPIN